MTELPPASASQRVSLAGRPGWVITDDKIGMQVQARGVADALGLDLRLVSVAPRAPYRWASPWGLPDPRDWAAMTDGRNPPVWPDIAIATGRLSIPFIRAMKRRSGGRVFTVILQDPKTGPSSADLVWVPAHDRLRGENVITTLTAPNSFSPTRFDALRATIPDHIRALPAPRVAVLLGGSTSSYRYDAAALARLGKALTDLGREGATFLVSSSRRTAPDLLAAADAATRDRPRVLYVGEGPNPYPHFLAAADLFAVTADSVNMTSEAAGTGKPVYVFHASEGRPKFRAFHRALEAHGACRPLDARSTLSPVGWTYAPLYAAGTIAAEIEKRYLAFITARAR